MVQQILRAEEVGELQDSLYLIKDPVSDHGNFPMAKMEVENGEIVSFKYSEFLATSGKKRITKITIILKG